ncbi:MAG TPA: chemotaxis protein CheB [Opitutaceae bacterium]|nr:chemotaxis protein CheB [Opitutaceae bacterium]
MKLNRDRRARKASGQSRATAAAAASKTGFPIVGVGGSAGGLEAFTQLLQHLPVDTGMAFIFVQHLDPEHESALPHILSRATAMPVREVKQGMLVAPNEIYVIPPNSTLRLARGRLDLKPRETSRMPHLAIDLFFKSLAQEQHEGAIGVVFSGNATDGTLGLEAIKAAGGITFAQDKTARYDSMPRSAIASGCVDHVMAPAGVARELARIATHPYLRGDLPPLADDLAPTAAIAPSPLAAPETGRSRPRGRSAAPLHGFAKIMGLAREQSGVDFTLYKTNTIHRRITRRMVLSRKNSLDDYARFVATDAKEFKALYADLLISVTSFFRDEAAFDALKNIIYPKLVAEKRSGPIRLWSIGCSSGQEAYSLGMAFMEATAELGDRAPKLQIFGTDLNEALLSKARHGLYPKSLAQEISAERLRRFFVEEDGGYRVIKALREVCIFARQDLLGDPPFSRMDLVTCRNVLIYLESAAQKRILPMLHYALKPEGFLFLGTSESIGAFGDLFEPLDKKQKVFARKSTTTPAFSIPFRDRRRAAPTGRGPRLPTVDETVRTELHAQQEADRIMVNLFAPPGVLVDAALNVLQFHGATEAYLASPAGKASFQLLKMAREGLMLPLRAALNQARKLKEPVRREKIHLGPGPAATVDLRVIPLRNLRERFFLVLFETPGTSLPVRAAAPEPPEPRGDRELRRRNVALERELRETRDYLQSLQQQHDTANDELQASNEEVQSTNEELQSINEELETSKEELESGNEELITVNEEMAYRNGELSRLNSDLNNFHVSISTPIVVLGRDLSIRRFTPLAEKLFNLLATDIGRPIGGIKHNLELDDLEGFVRKVIDLLAARESEVRDKDGHWHLLRARPYLTVDNKIDGAVLVLLDIDALKRSEQAITQERNYAEATLRTARDPIVILRPDLTVNTANDAFYRTFELTPAQTENRRLYELADGAWNIPALRTLLADVLPRNHFFNDLEVTHQFGGIGARTMLLNGRRLESEQGAPLRILLSIEDVTERRRSSAALRASEVRYRRLFEAAKDGVIIIDPATRRITEVNPFMVQLLGYRRDEFLGKELFEIGLFRDERAAQQAFLDLREKQEIRYEHLPLKAKDGTPHEVEVVANLYDEDGRAVIQCNVRDITDRKRMSDDLRASELRYRSLFDSIDEGFCIVEVLFDEKGKPADYRFEEVNPSFETQSGLREVLGKRIREVVPTIENHWMEIYGRVAETGQPIRQINESPALNRWFEVFCFPVGPRDSRKVAILFTDVTDQKKLRSALEASESYFRELTQNLPVGVWTSLSDGRVDFINRHWLEYSGLTFHHAMTHQDAWTKNVHPDDRERAEKISAAACAVDEGYQLEARFREARSGAYHWFLKRSVPIRDEDGRLRKRIGICVDIDAQKRAHYVLAAHAGALEEQVQARTGELRETIGELEAFSYSVSHDMRAPLRAMQGFAQLLLKNHEATLDARSIDHLRRINTSAARLDALIEDVLTYSRLLRSDIVLQPVSLDELVRRVVATYPQLQANGAEVAIEGTLPTVLANEASLTQVVSNLLTNAVKFVAPGAKAQVTIRAEEIEGDVRLWIEDQGIGIDPRDHERIWTIFTRIGRAKDYEGTGIGLAIARKAVERMNGAIGLESQLGQGSKFWLRLRKG